MDKNLKKLGASKCWQHVFRPATCLRVSGEDAFSFLQGQFTQDLRSTTGRSVSYGLWLNQKGRVLADSYVLRESDAEFLVVSLGSSSTVIRERLEAYVIADDVVIEDETALWGGVVVGGTEAESWLAVAAGALPAAGEFVRAGGGWVFRGRRGAETSFEWIRPVGAEPLAGPEPIADEELERRRVAAGIARVPHDIGSGELPNEGGLDACAVSYTKGCYLGQEVMARLKSMGTLRRRLVRVKGLAQRPPAVPCALLQGERRVGELRSAVDDGEGGFVGLALVTKLGLDPVVRLAPEPGGDGMIELIDTP